jgi:hypothetical protein
MTIAQNQFNQTPLQGEMDLLTSPTIVAGVISSTSGGGLVAGQSVKMVDGTSAAPAFVECAADTDDVYGFIVYNMKNATFEVGDAVEVAAMRNSVMYMTASAAVARNAQVMVVIASKKVATATSSKRIVGRAYDKASADGDLIRVTIDLPGATV